jgi:OmpA-OmpF porin, OOP family
MTNFKVIRLMIAAVLTTAFLGGCISAKSPPMAAATPAPSEPAPTMVAPAPTVEAGQVVLQLPDTLFEFDKSTLTAQARSILDNAVSDLQANPAMMYEVAGHTDSIGSDAYNMELSRQRAESVVDYLVMRGIDGSRLRAVGYGERNPVAPNQNADGSDNPQGRALNRRVEILAM